MLRWLRRNLGFETSVIARGLKRCWKNLGIRFGLAATEIRRRAWGRQKDRPTDAELIVDLLLKNEFPSIHRVSAENREVLWQLRGWCSNAPYCMKKATR